MKKIEIVRPAVIPNTKPIPSVWKNGLKYETVIPKEIHKEKNTLAPKTFAKWAPIIRTQNVASDNSIVAKRVKPATKWRKAKCSPSTVIIDQIGLYKDPRAWEARSLATTIAKELAIGEKGPCPVRNLSHYDGYKPILRSTLTPKAVIVFGVSDPVFEHNYSVGEAIKAWYKVTPNVYLIEVPLEDKTALQVSYPKDLFPEEFFKTPMPEEIDTKIRNEANIYQSAGLIQYNTKLFNHDNMFDQIDGWLKVPQPEPIELPIVARERNGAYIKYTEICSEDTTLDEKIEFRERNNLTKLSILAPKPFQKNQMIDHARYAWDDKSFRESKHILDIDDKVASDFITTKWFYQNHPELLDEDVRFCPDCGRPLRRRDERVTYGNLECVEAGGILRNDAEEIICQEDLEASEFSSSINIWLCDSCGFEHDFEGFCKRLSKIRPEFEVRKFITEIVQKYDIEKDIFDYQKLFDNFIKYGEIIDMEWMREARAFADEKVKEYPVLKDHVEWFMNFSAENDMPHEKAWNEFLMAMAEKLKFEEIDALHRKCGKCREKYGDDAWGHIDCPIDDIWQYRIVKHPEEL